MFSQNVKDLEKAFNKNGFIRASREAGPTVRWNFLKFTMDHLFSKGLEVLSTGTVESKASDHKALWVWLKIPKDIGS